MRFSGTAPPPPRCTRSTQSSRDLNRLPTGCCGTPARGRATLSSRSSHWRMQAWRLIRESLLGMAGSWPRSSRASPWESRSASSSRPLRRCTQASPSSRQNTRGGSWPGREPSLASASRCRSLSPGRPFQALPTSRPPRSPCSSRRYFRPSLGLPCSGERRVRSLSKRRRTAPACKYHSPPAFRRDPEQEVFR